MVDSVFELLPNFDNSQDFEWPLGNKPDDPQEEVPPAIQDLLATTLTSSAIQISGTVPSAATHVNIQRSFDGLTWSDITRVTSLPYNNSGLLDDTEYFYRAYTENAAGWSPIPSNTTSDTTDEAVVIGELLFSDDFSTYNVGQKLNNVAPPIALNGARWWYPRADFSEDEPIIVAGGYGGDAKALGFRFNPRYTSYSYAYSEQDFKLCATAETALPALWIEYYVYWPSNYALVGQQNDKTFDLLTKQFGQITSTHYGGDYWSDHETWRKGSGQKKMISQNPSSNWNGVRDNWGHALGDWATAPFHGGSGSDSFQGSNKYDQLDATNDGKLFWNQSVDNGNWRQYRFQIQPASAQGTFDAVFRVWKDGVKIAEIKDSDFKDQYISGFDSGYIFGWQRSGVAESCVVKLSRIKMYTVDQGWT